MKGVTAQKISWSGWTSWISFKKDNLKKITEKAGAYIISGRGHDIERFGGTDRDGIIDIGESQDLHRRINDFYNVVFRLKKSPHMAGWRFNHLGISKIVEPSSLRFCYKYQKTHKKLEAKIMKWYVSRYFELPPLNYKFNWSDYFEEND